VSVLTSIVIPVHDRAALTERCLDAVLPALPKDSELIVVDDASTDCTPELLDGYGDSIRRVALASNGGYAHACNEGLAAAHGDSIIFLNNDTEPQPGWLEILQRYATANPAVVAVGAKLVYPTGVVQHAGVVIGQDGYPHNLYAGMEADHPAVNRSRRLQAVTGACMLVDRGAFEAVGGFDTGFLNSLEDVDLCLRLGAEGGEVHYCHEAVVVHLESASRGRLDRFERSVALYQRRWRDTVRRDDLEVYLADGLISVEYADSHPVRMTVDPLLAVVDRGREEEIERLLETYARQVSDLLGEVVRLSASPVCSAATLAPGSEVLREPFTDPADREEFLARVRRIEEEIRQLQSFAEPATGLGPGPRLGYRRLIERVRGAVEEQVPAGATVLVISRGDRELMRLGARRGEHFPQDEEGRYAGHHPADSEEAIAQLERMRERGAEYLLVPPTAAWWLEHYGAFAAHLRERYRRLGSEVCEIYELAAEAPAPGDANRMVG
jgi:GT2 family glycosyltransferase